jgi:CHAT domain-containing protein
MERFYAYLLDEPQSPAAALKKAQERLRRFSPRYQEPYFWAAFTFYGA